MIVAQRISSVKNADIILILKDGRITESGTHQELLEKKGFEYETLSYYQDAIILKEAKENYAEDLDSYETYIQNELEVQANVYADAEVGALSAIYGW